MSDQPDPHAAPPSGDGVAAGSGARPDPGPGPAPDDRPDAIGSRTVDDRVRAEPGDADRPNPRPRTDDPATGSGATGDVGDEAASPGADDASVPDYEQLAAADPRTPGQLLAALHAAEATAGDYLEALQRKQAEFENFRKRMQAQGQAQRIAGHADVASRMLEVLDDFDRTLDSIADDVDDRTLRGVRLVRDKLMGALAEVGLERVDDHGAPFDPNRHEAVQQVPGDGIIEQGNGPVVVEVLRPGYVLGPRVLRAAMVAVAQ